MSRVTSIEQLRQLYNGPTERAVKKDIGHIDIHCRCFIELSPFLAISTHNSKLQADCSPRGGKPGFVKILDSKSIIIPDWNGNNRLDTFCNLLENNSIGLMFIIPGVDEILRANGSAELRTDEQFKVMCMENEKLPKLVVLVRVDEVYLHCAKALMRANLWCDAVKINRQELPSAGRMLKDQIGGTDEPETSEAMYERYKHGLY